MPLSRATWTAITQTREKAIDYLRSLTLPNPDLESRAQSQMAVWQLIGNDRAGALQNASIASRNAASPLSKAFALAAMLIASGDDSAEELRSRIAASPGDDATKRAVLGYGLFLYHRYSEAAGIWEAAYRTSGGTDLRSRAMLAACLERAGRTPEANALHVEAFVPNLSGDDEYAIIPFSEMRRLLKPGS